MPFITTNWDENQGYTGDNPFAEGSQGWSYEDNKGWVKYVPSTNPTLNAEQIKNLTPYTINYDASVGQPRFEINAGQGAATDPNAYYLQLSSDLANRIHENNATNSGEKNAEYIELLNNIKDVNPAAYYNGQVQLLANEIGHAAVMGETARQEKAQKQLAELGPDAIKAGVAPEQLQSTVNSAFYSGANLGQLVKSNAAEEGNFWTKNLIGSLQVAAVGLGAYGIDSALAAAANAAAAGGAAGAGAGAAGTGGGFGLTASSIPSLAGGLELGAATGAGTGAAGFGLTGASAGGLGLTASSVPSLIGGLEVGTAGALGSTPFLSGLEQMGPTYQELGITGLEPGQMGPTYGELGYNGLNQQAAIDAANAASQGMSVSDVLSNANRLKNIAKLLNQSSPTASKSINPSNIPTANQFAAYQQATQPLQEQFGGLYRMNQNPFSFGTQGQTVASQGMYDVSGGNPMSNALRKA